MLDSRYQFQLVENEEGPRRRNLFLSRNGSWQHRSGFVVQRILKSEVVF